MIGDGRLSCASVEFRPPNVLIKVREFIKTMSYLKHSVLRLYVKFLPLNMLITVCKFIKTTSRSSQFSASLCQVPSTKCVNTIGRGTRIYQDNVSELSVFCLVSSSNSNIPRSGFKTGCGAFFPWVYKDKDVSHLFLNLLP